ncbi:MAG: carbonic anhydrase [Lentimicrobiaceae bacterium]|jgi:carbonic anhydrase|nr:carbonic anhydrase [Lentimicrobiaceae bacterium]
MPDIHEGIIRFRQHDFEANRQHFKALEREQKPHTLFIGCSDSRVVPSLITQTMPGELFIVRNIANLVPMYRESGEFLATTSAIEYAVLMLNVENIIVCGHSNCGGCAALWETQETLDKIPHTRRWLELAKPVKKRVEKALMGQNPEAREWLTEQMNVAQQLCHLKTYPYIKERLKAGTITLFGWHYMIPTGSIYEYHPGSKEFKLIDQPSE